MDSEQRDDMKNMNYVAFLDYFLCEMAQATQSPGLHGVVRCE